MGCNRPDEFAKARLTDILTQAARARRLAVEFARDPVAKQLTQYADELTAEAARIEAEGLQARRWKF